MGSGPAPRGVLAACAAALLAAAVTGCSGPGPGSGAGSPTGSGPASTADPTPRAASPEDLCTALITHWAGIVLDGETRGSPGPGGLDYQSMGLSGDQNEILRAVLADARAALRATGGGPGTPGTPAAADTAARQLVAREARARCAERHRSAVPTGGPWG